MLIKNKINKTRGKNLKVKFLFLFIVILILSGCNKKENKNILSVYNFGDYIDKKILDIFAQENKIKINYDTFATSEDAYAKIKNASVNYDVVIISDYMIERMQKENLLAPLDFDEIKNYKNIFRDFEFKSKYAIPYVWGTVGILYNKKFITQEPTSWKILWDKKYKNKIFMYDTYRDSIGVALKKLNFDINTRDIKKLLDAKQELITQKKLVQAYVGDLVKDKMIAEEGALAVAYSGDAFFSQQANKNLDFIIPNEGSNIWFDCMIILKSCVNKQNAHKFLDFMCREDIALLNAKHNGYTTANIKAFEKLDFEIKNNKIYWPSQEEIKKCEIYHDLDNFTRIYDRIWIEILASD